MEDHVHYIVGDFALRLQLGFLAEADLTHGLVCYFPYFLVGHIPEGGRGDIGPHGEGFGLNLNAIGVESVDPPVHASLLHPVFPSKLEFLCHEVPHYLLPGFLYDGVQKLIVRYGDQQVEVIALLSVFGVLLPLDLQQFIVQKQYLLDGPLGEDAASISLYFFLEVEEEATFYHLLLP